MPTTFWNDRSEDAPSPVDAAAARETYLSDAASVAALLRRDPGALAAWVSGPFEPPRTAPRSDLHMGLLTRGGGEVVYRHVLPPFSPVGRRLEIACIPLETMRSTFGRGFADWGAVVEARRLQDIVILFERDGVLTELRMAAAALKPARLFIGHEIEGLVARCGLAEQRMREGAFSESIMISRDLMLHALRLVALVCTDGAVSKSTDLYAMRARCFPRDLVERFETAERVRGMHEREARRLVERAGSLVTRSFERSIT